jgi:hypothetical protein
MRGQSYIISDLPRGVQTLGLIVDTFSHQLLGGFIGGPRLNSLRRNDGITLFGAFGEVVGLAGGVPGRDSR